MYLEIITDRSVRARTAKSLKRHFPLLMRPMAFAVACIWVWTQMRSFGITFGPSESVYHTALPTLSFAYAIFASWVLDMVAKKYRQVSVCLVEDDMHTFLINRDERTPVLIDLLLFALSMLLLSATMLVDFDNARVGAFAVFSVAFVVDLFLIVATELDDPKRSVWFKERIPQQWLEIDIDEYRRTIRSRKDDSMSGESQAAVTVESP